MAIFHRRSARFISFPENQIVCSPIPPETKLLITLVFIFQTMSVTGPIAKEALARLFSAPNCRAYRVFQKKEVSDELLKEIYDNLKWGPTAFNCSPLRVNFVKSAEARAKLIPTLAPGNIPHVESAPVTAILGFDKDFLSKIDKLNPTYAGAGEYFRANTHLIETSANLNGVLQMGYFISVARAVGLDVGPMNGFDIEACDKAFFEGTNITARVLVNLGYGDESALWPRAPRLDFEEACEIL